jgi:hypothetical protein
VPSDVNGDGRQDLLVISREDGVASFLEGSPTGPQLVTSALLASATTGGTAGRLNAPSPLLSSTIQPTALALAGVGSGQVLFYVAARGFDSAGLYSFSLNLGSQFESSGGFTSPTGGGALSQLPAGLDLFPGGAESSPFDSSSEFAAPSAGSIALLLNTGETELVGSLVAALIGQGVINSGLVSIGNSTLAMVATLLFSPSLGSTMSTISLGNPSASKSPLIGPGTGDGGDGPEVEPDDDADAQEGQAETENEEDESKPTPAIPGRSASKSANALDRFFLRLDQSLDELHSEATGTLDEALIRQVADSVLATSKKPRSETPSAGEKLNSSPLPTVPGSDSPESRSHKALESLPQPMPSASSADRSQPESNDYRGVTVIGGLVTAAGLLSRSLASRRQPIRFSRSRARTSKDRNPEHR